MTFRAESSRRRFLATAAGAAGVAVAVGPVSLAMASPAGAQNLPGPDAELAGALQGAELAAAAFYEKAVTMEGIDAELIPIMEEFGRHHREQAGAIAGLIGPGAPGQADQELLDRSTRTLRATSTSEEVLGLAFALENTLVSTHLAAIGTLEASDVAAISASILPVQSQHAVVIAQAAGLDLDDYMPTFESITGAIDVAPEGQ